MQQVDPRENQILFLSLFLALGIGTRDWTLRPDFIIVAIATCLCTQWIANTLRQRIEPQKFPTKQAPDGDRPRWASSLSNLKSALITALGLSLLLRTDHYSTMVLAGTLAIGSKFLR
ncbi:MAG: hypothetical protein EBE86_002210 [Hormoscilla sp. GUM202]|nr:hypothetical protein [Hormoscilla sp. GM7CHS1pb]MBO1346275.1 hypothetical protein [Hormoscilla sp. GUM202]